MTQLIVTNLIQTIRLTITFLNLIVRWIQLRNKPVDVLERQTILILDSHSSIFLVTAGHRPST